MKSFLICLEMQRDYICVKGYFLKDLWINSRKICHKEPDPEEKTKGNKTARIRVKPWMIWLSFKGYRVKNNMKKLNALK